MWAAGCVVAETMAGPPSYPKLFDSGPLGSDLALLQSIFRTLGTPMTDGEGGTEWPEARGFPDWGKMSFHVYEARAWEEVLPMAGQEARDLVGQLVRYESGERLTAGEDLKMSD
ncbi:MAG: hypothetical protein LQ352_007801 [Teloschistes flavicans]|nr:MAG: hypothetical protein LQ352_007801 [Teloschistes flavicans]